MGELALDLIKNLGYLLYAYIVDSFILQAPCPGDSGAPLLSIGEENKETNERLGQTLLGIHSGGDNTCIAKGLFRRKTYPQWWIRVRL